MIFRIFYMFLWSVGVMPFPEFPMELLATGGCLNCAVDLGPGVYRTFSGWLLSLCCLPVLAAKCGDFLPGKIVALDRPSLLCGKTWIRCDSAQPRCYIPKKTFFIACFFCRFPLSWAIFHERSVSQLSAERAQLVGWLDWWPCTNCSMMLRCLKDVQWAAFHGIVAASSAVN